MTGTGRRAPGPSRTRVEQLYERLRWHVTMWVERESEPWLLFWPPAHRSVQIFERLRRHTDAWVDSEAPSLLVLAPPFTPNCNRDLAAHAAGQLAFMGRVQRSDPELAAGRRRESEVE